MTPHLPLHPRPRRRLRGVVGVYALVMMVALVGFCSLAVDYGRVQVVRAELRRAADAAARAAGFALPSGTTAATTAAVDVATANTADGDPIPAAAVGVEFGHWDPAAKAFTPVTGYQQSSAKAVRVTVYRTAARGGAVPLVFAKLVGKDSSDVAASAVVNTTPASQGYGIVGLNWVKLSGNPLIDSYDSRLGNYSAWSARNHGSVVSNGDITLGGNATIRGDVSPGPGDHVVLNGSPTISGSTRPLSTALQYPAPSAGTYATANDNSRLGGQYLQPDGDFVVPARKTADLPAGTYHVRDFRVSANATLNVTGDVTLYVTGDFDLSGNASVAQNLARNFKVRMVTPGTKATLAGTSDFCADFYAPASDVTVAGNADFYGAVVGRTLTLGGNGGVHYDESLTSATPVTAHSVSLVK